VKERERVRRNGKGGEVGCGIHGGCGFYLKVRYYVQF
jgi:hypothetical protein